MLRLIAGVPATACADLLFKELGMRRLEYTWWKRTVGFWNNLASLPSTSLHYQVALHNCRLAVAGGSRNWAFGVMMGLRRIGYCFTIRCDRLNPIDWSVVRSCLSRQAEEAWTGLHVSPRLCATVYLCQMVCQTLLWVPALICHSTPSWCPPRAGFLTFPVRLPQSTYCCGASDWRPSLTTPLPALLFRGHW